MFNFILIAVHFFSYFTTCLFYFIKDIKLFYRINAECEWNAVKLQKYRTDLLDIWSNALENSFTNIMVSSIFILFLPSHQVSYIKSILNIPLYIVLVDCLFYFIHKILHKVPCLYKYHKQHHSTKLVVAPNGLDADIYEHIFLNIGSIFIPYIILGFSNSFMVIYVCYASFSAASSHSGYKHSIRHNLHHQYTNVNYGTGFYIMDRLFGTFKST